MSYKGQGRNGDIASRDILLDAYGIAVMPLSGSEINKWDVETS